MDDVLFAVIGGGDRVVTSFDAKNIGANKTMLHSRERKVVRVIGSLHTCSNSGLG
jgi:hypothetical protein